MQVGNLSKVIASSVLVVFLAACSSTGETTDAASSSTQAAQAAADAAALAESQALEEAQAQAQAAEAAAAAEAEAAEAEAEAAEAEAEAEAEAAAEATEQAAQEAAQQAADEAAAVAQELAQQQQQAQDAAQALAHLIYFDFDQSTIKAEFRTALNGHAAYLSQNPTAKIVLEGHADERGTREYNIALGERRGNAVSRYLVVQGVSVDAIEVVSFGEERPVNAGHDSASWAENRRVEIRYINY
jgi:peptidoglycan-associated lipoprotein